MLTALGALAAGLVNSLASGGTLISFPMLTSPPPADAANVTKYDATLSRYLGTTLAQSEDLSGKTRRL